MFKAIKESKLFYCALSVMIAAGFVAGLGGKTYAAGKTAEVSSADELTAALADEDVDHIVITQSFDVPCTFASNSVGTSYFKVDRNMIIEGANPDITLRRVADTLTNNGYLQSLFGICGNGNMDEVQVSFFNLTLDGGAIYGDTTGTDRMNISLNRDSRNDPNMKDFCLGGRSLMDVYQYGTLNLENGLTIQNSYCTYSLSSVSGSAGSSKYGGAVRVDWELSSGGGTVNVKAGSHIKGCVTTSGYGGALGCYSNARLNVYGGIIEECSSYFGGAIGCTYRNGHSSTVAGTFKMYGGIISNCSAMQGGAISADGNPDKYENCLYGGTIENCVASGYGGAVALGGSGDGIPNFHIAPYDVNGPLFIRDCVSGYTDTSSETEYGGKPLGYSGLFLGGSSSPIIIEGTTNTFTFFKYIDDTEPYATLTVKEGSSLGESFPADPTGDFPFIEWNTNPDGSGTKVTQDTKISLDTTVYARWLYPAKFTDPEDLTLTYGDEDKKIEIKDASAAYGGSITYQWYTCTSSGESSEIIDGATDSEYQIPKLAVGDYYYRCVVKNSAPVSDISVESNIVKVTVEPKTVDLTWSDLEFVFNGAAKMPNAVANGFRDGDDVAVKISGEQTKAGTYKANAVLTGKDATNYVIASGKDSVEFVIKPAPTATPTAKPQVPDEVKMPDLKGMNYKDAQTKLEKFLKDNGINATVSIGWGHNSDPKKNLTVASTTPNAGEKIATDTKTIIIMVYEGYNPPANALTLDKTKISVVVGKTAQLKATLTGYSSAVTWKSSDTKIATVDKNGKITTKMAGTVTITASVSNLTSASCEVTVLYKDVTNTKDFWYVPTNYLSGKGVVKGYDKQTLFKPANMCTRAQMVTFIWRLQGEPTPKAKTCKFKDVKKTDYFYKACIWGNENHIVEGYKNGTFGPQIVCARKHAVTFLWRLANKPNPSSKTNKFKDVKKSDYFYQATLWASEKGILAGYSDGTFRPDGDCLRRQMVTFLYKYDKFVNGKG